MNATEAWTTETILLLFTMGVCATILIGGIFFILNDYSNGAYAHAIIMKGVLDGSYGYLHGYQKDFFCITRK